MQTTQPSLEYTPSDVLYLGLFTVRHHVNSSVQVALGLFQVIKPLSYTTGKILKYMHQQSKLVACCCS